MLPLHTERQAWQHYDWTYVQKMLLNNERLSRATLVAGTYVRCNLITNNDSSRKSTQFKLISYCRCGNIVRLIIS